MYCINSYLCPIPLCAPAAGPMAAEDTDLCNSTRFFNRCTHCLQSSGVCACMNNSLANIGSKLTTNNSQIDIKKKKNKAKKMKCLPLQGATHSSRFCRWSLWIFTRHPEKRKQTKSDKCYIFLNIWLNSIKSIVEKKIFEIEKKWKNNYG